MVRGMHVLLCVREDDASLAPALAAAWRAGAPSCDVRTVALPDPPSHDAAEAGRAGVFVPLEALGLTSATGAEDGPLTGPAAESDLVVVHVPVLDGTTLREGRVPAAVAAAAPHAVPVVVLAGRSEVSRREWSGAGVSGVHETGADAVATTARVARTWAPSWA
ncbi:hypothetical protein AAG589_02445 [Isoptericola sp. F-RaC21]|uniref:hypothetical protein n=1 Tax=Isoptericola sp. F-RaC21 TaxID=3141452 RepID=UPI00315BC002